jgi:hypothetical protein
MAAVCVTFNPQERTLQQSLDHFRIFMVILECTEARGICKNKKIITHFYIGYKVQPTYKSNARSLKNETCEKGKHDSVITPLNVMPRSFSPHTTVAFILKDVA